MEAFARLKALLHDEIESRQAKIKTEDSQLALIRKEMAGVQQLVDKGLARTPRMLDLKRQLADIQGQRLDYETAVLEARQQVNNTERMMTELQDKRREEIALEHRLAEERLTTLQRKLMTSERLLFEAEVIAPRNQDNHRDLKENYEPTYSIVRPSADGPEVTEATEASMIQPGDTIKVEVPSLAEEYNPKVAGRPVSN